jgi:CRP-like cAMP-binding protein
MSKPSDVRNWLLQQLEPSTWREFAGRIQPVALAKDDILQRQGDLIERVYFPDGALVGLISAMPAGDTVQTAMVGWDGAVGVFEACGTRRSAFLAEVQVEGKAYCLSARDYRALFEASAPLRNAVHKYVEALLAEARQFVACTALHGVEARLARSILEALERSRDGRALPVTQEALAEMLGVQRTTVSSAVSRLQDQKVLRSRRGVVHVEDISALERLACCCREALQLARAEIYSAEEPVCDT